MADLTQDPGQLVRALLVFLLALVIFFAILRLVASYLMNLYLDMRERRWQLRSKRSGASAQELQLGADIFRALGRLRPDELEECKGMSKDQLIAYLDGKFKNAKRPSRVIKSD